MATAGSSTNKQNGTETQSSSHGGEHVRSPAIVPLVSTYLDELSRRIRSRPIPWEGYARADLVTQDELRMIRSIDDKQDAEVQRLWEESGDKYAALYVRLLAKLTRTDTLQQILVLMGDMLAGHDERMQLFLQVKGQDQGNTWPYQPLLKLIEAQDEFCQLKAAQFLTLALTSKRPEDVAEAPTHVLDRLLSFFAALINTGVPGGSHAYTTLPGAGALRPPSAQGGYAEGNGADVAIQLLEALLRSKKYRNMFWDDELRKIGHPSDSQDKSKDDKEEGQAGEMTSVLYGLRSILMASLVGKATRSTTPSGTSTPAASIQTGSTTLASASGSRTPAGSVGVQLVYQVVFCFWLLSFETDIAAELNAKFGIVPVLTDVARNAVKEKVVRIIVATLRNLVENAPNANTSAILGNKGLALMESLGQRKYSDEEIAEDIDVVKKALSDKLKVMSTYDQFLSELSAGRLTWDNPAHSLDDFWKENTSKLLEVSSNDEGVNESGLTLLLNIVKNADNTSDATSLAIACNDIGKMLQFSPEGAVRKRIEKQGGKAYVMALISHEDGQVKFHALHAVSKLVSASWRG